MASLWVWLGHQETVHEAPKDSVVSSVNLRLCSQLDNVEELMGRWVTKVVSMAKKAVVPSDLKSLGCRVAVDETW